MVHFLRCNRNESDDKGVVIMPSKQLDDLVNKYKKAGIRISLVKPRSKMSLYLYEDPTISADMNEYPCYEKNRKRTLECI